MTTENEPRTFYFHDLIAERSAKTKEIHAVLETLVNRNVITKVVFKSDAGEEHPYFEINPDKEYFPPSDTMIQKLYHKLKDRRDKTYEGMNYHHVFNVVEKKMKTQIYKDLVRLERKLDSDADKMRSWMVAFRNPEHAIVKRFWLRKYYIYDKTLLNFEK